MEGTVSSWCIDGNGALAVDLEGELGGAYHSSAYPQWNRGKRIGLTLDWEDLDLCDLDVEGRVGQSWVDVKLLVEGGLVEELDRLDIDLTLVVVLVVVLSVVNQQLGQEQRVWDVVVRDDLLQSPRSEWREEVKLELGGQKTERDVGRCEQCGETGSVELGLSRLTVLSVVLPVEVVLAVEMLDGRGQSRVEVWEEVGRLED